MPTITSAPGLAEDHVHPFFHLLLHLCGNFGLVHPTYATGTRHLKHVETRLIRKIEPKTSKVWQRPLRMSLDLGPSATTICLFVFDLNRNDLVNTKTRKSACKQCVTLFVTFHPESIMGTCFGRRFGRSAYSSYVGVFD